MRQTFPPDLELDEHHHQHRREHLVERIAWPLLYALLAAIGFGLLGQGPLADVELRTADGRGAVAFQRFMTVRSGQELQITLPPVRGGTDGAAASTVVISHGWLRDVDVQRLAPEPAQSRLQSDGVAYVFHHEASRPVQVQLQFEPRTVGRLQGTVSVAGAEPLALHQFVYP